MVVNGYADVFENNTSYLSDTTCDPQLAGITETLFQNQNGCDSLVIEEVILLESDIDTFYFETCDTNQVGSIQTTYNNQNGCDSVEFIQTELVESDVVLISQNTCENNEVGTDSLFFTNINGCDSLVNITKIYFHQWNWRLQDSLIMEISIFLVQELGMVK